MLIKTQEGIKFYKLAIEVERNIKKRNKDPVSILAMREQLDEAYQRYTKEVQHILGQGDKRDERK